MFVVFFQSGDTQTDLNIQNDMVLYHNIDTYLRYMHFPRVCTIFFRFMDVSIPTDRTSPGPTAPSELFPKCGNFSV